MMDVSGFTYQSMFDFSPKEFQSFIAENREHIIESFPVTLRSCENLAKTKTYFKQAKKLEAAGKWKYFVIVGHNNPEILGFFVVKEISAKIKRGELAYFVDRNFSGKGIISKIAPKIIAYVFEELGLNKILICTSSKNMASQKIALKNNFKREGILRQEFLNYFGNLEDINYYGLLKSDYHSHEK
ncbi:GNAT family protein [Gramella sp. AN32]|uniref:GNAT family N-acetyltransferase n=1 Tax=Christiangramia antarctica TaxID=2058158 RepID=A0ABW5WYT4_9FLAO|nr:GNAT family protein [Gramella sp. AN32]MCM4155076.1 N-acetyltransferase [Gramella sp. AN32]